MRSPEEERGGNLAVRATLGDERGDTSLRGCQTLDPSPPADPAELGACRLDPGRRAEPLELAERRGDRVAGGALLPLAPADHAEREQRTGPPEGVADRLVLRDCVLEERRGLGHVSAGGCHEPAAARDVGEHPGAFESSRIRLPRVDDPLGVVRPIEREQRLDVVGHPPAFACLAPAEPGGRRL